MAPLLPRGLLTRVLDVAATAEDAGRTPGGLAAHLDAGALEAALGLAHRIADRDPRATALVAIALALDAGRGLDRWPRRS